VQEDRNKALESAAEDGVIRNYSGWRQSLKGTRFHIKDCTLFNLETPTGKKVMPYLSAIPKQSRLIETGLQQATAVLMRIL